MPQRPSRLTSRPPPAALGETPVRFRMRRKARWRDDKEQSRPSTLFRSLLLLRVTIPSRRSTPKVLGRLKIARTSIPLPGLAQRPVRAPAACQGRCRGEQLRLPAIGGSDRPLQKPLRTGVTCVSHPARSTTRLENHVGFTQRPQDGWCDVALLEVKPPFGVASLRAPPHPPPRGGCREARAAYSGPHLD